MSHAYDLFREDEDGFPIWVETVSALDIVKERLTELAGEKSGQYLVYNPTEGRSVEPFKQSA